VGVPWRPPLAVAIVTYLVTQSFLRVQMASGSHRQQIPSRLTATPKLTASNNAVGSHHLTTYREVRRAIILL
jgi:hypothetical protein